MKKFDYQSAREAGHTDEDINSYVSKNNLELVNKKTVGQKIGDVIGQEGAAPIGATIGAGVGLLGGPAAPLTVPLGAFAGGMVGKAVQRGGELLSGKAEEQEPISAVMGAGAESAAYASLAELGYQLPNIAKLGIKGIKALNPFKITGGVRDTAVKTLEDMGVTMNEPRIAEDLMNYAEDEAPLTMQKAMRNYALQAIDKFVDPNASISKTLVDLNKANEAAYLQSGHLGRPAAAQAEKVIGDSIRRQLAERAPDVAAANKAFEKLFNIKRAIGKLSFPARIAGGTALGRAILE